MKKTRNKYIDLYITLEDLFNGAVKSISFKKSIICEYCTVATSTTCPLCAGEGVNMKFKNMDGDSFKIDHNFILCHECEGSGKKYNLQCHFCDNLGIVFQTRTIIVNIMRGMNPQELIVFSAEANQQSKMIPGDVIVRLVVKPHPYFEISSASTSDLIYKHYESGSTVEIPTLDNHILTIDLSRHSKILGKPIMLGDYGLWNRSGTGRGSLSLIFM
jgi:DnaJ-class molecular chaperone